MKLKLGTNLILAIGLALAIGLSYWQATKWYAFVLAPFALWALIYSYEEINQLGWHYRLANRYFKNELKGVCKACPYWGLVALSAFIMLIQVTYGIAAQVFIYAWHTVWLLMGFRPDWRVLAYHGIPGRVRMYKRQPSLDYRGNRSTTIAFDPARMFITFIAGMTMAILLALHVINRPFYLFYHDQPAYFTVPGTYLGILAVAGLVELWLVTGWPAVKWAYDKSCPDAKFVQKVPVTTQPGSTPAARTR